MAYRDSGGVLTIGYGHTGPDVKAGMKITLERAEDLLEADLRAAATVVLAKVRVPLSGPQAAALTDFVFNVGATQFAGSTLLRLLNAGDYASVPLQLMRWVYDNGKVVAGLRNRRIAEVSLWNS